MSENNSKLKVELINLEEEQQSKMDFPLYKIIPYKYLLKWIYADKIRFDKVAKWDDVYELFLFKQKYIQNGEIIDFKAESEAIYGQSWSMEGNSDALWRIYSPDKLSVQIKTTCEKFIHLLERSDVFSNQMGAFLGKVRYMEQEQVEDKIREYSNDIYSHKNIVDSLYIKRTPFSYEKEIRILLRKATIEERNGVNYQCEIPCFINLDIRPIDLITEVTFDARLDDNLCSCLKSALQALLPGVQMQKSALGIFESNTYTI